MSDWEADLDDLKPGAAVWDADEELFAPTTTNAAAADDDDDDWEADLEEVPGTKPIVPTIEKVKSDRDAKNIEKKLEKLREEQRKMEASLPKEDAKISKEAQRKRLEDAEDDLIDDLFDLDVVPKTHIDVSSKPKAETKTAVPSKIIPTVVEEKITNVLVSLDKYKLDTPVDFETLARSLSTRLAEFSGKHAHLVRFLKVLMDNSMHILTIDELNAVSSYSKTVSKKFIKQIQDKEKEKKAKKAKVSLRVDNDDLDDFDDFQEDFEEEEW